MHIALHRGGFFSNLLPRPRPCLYPGLGLDFPIIRNTVVFAFVMWDVAISKSVDEIHAGESDALS